MKNTESVYIDRFKFFKKKRDNTYQIKVKIRVPAIDFQRDFPIEYVADGIRYKLSITKDEWNNLSKSHEKIISRSEFKYEECVRHLLANNLAVTSANINHYYNQNVFDFTKDVQVDKLRGLLAYDLPPEMIDDTYSDDEVLEMAKEIEVGSEEVLQAEEVGMHMLEAKEKINLKRKVKETNALQSPLERCDAQYAISDFPDFTKIIDVFGYYWCLKKFNNERYLTIYDNKIVLRIAQFIFTTNASNRIEDFNEEWLKNYFFHLRDFGYIDTRKIQNYTPLELYDYKNIFIEKNNNRKPYSESSYVDQLKKFKQYFKILKKKTPYLDTVLDINIKDFNLPSLRLANTDFSEDVTQKDHYVDVEELKQLVNYSSSNKKLNLTRDLFFIQVFTSGNRSIDKDVVRFKTYKGIQYIEVEHSKTKSINISGMFKPLKKIILKHKNQIPEIEMEAKDYNKQLKMLAKELGLNRKIEFVYNKMNSKETTYEYKPLYKCLSQYFSRHTLVNYLVDAGTPDGEIIEITGHVSTDVLEHYKKKNTVKRKQKIIDKADEKYDW